MPLPHFKAMPYASYIVDFALAFSQQPYSELWFAQAPQDARQAYNLTMLEAYLVTNILDGILWDKTDAVTAEITLRYHHEAISTEIASRTTKQTLGAQQAVRMTTLFANTFISLHKILCRHSTYNSDHLLTLMSGLDEQDKQGWRANMITMHCLFLLFTCHKHRDAPLPYETQKHILCAWWQWEVISARCGMTHIAVDTLSPHDNNDAVGTQWFMARNLAVFVTLTEQLPSPALNGETGLRDMTQDGALRCCPCHTERKRLQAFFDTPPDVDGLF